jgi:hypothetical protein
MKALIVGFVLVVALGWVFTRPACGRSGALACPDPALDAGLGQTLSAAEICPRSGYLCHGRRGSFDIARWPLSKGKLRVRVSLPDFLDKETAEIVREQTIDGILEWEGHPFPLVIDDGPIPLRPFDIEVVWSQGLYNAALGVATNSWRPDGDGLKFKSHGLAVVVPPIAGTGARGGPGSMPMGPLLLTRIKATAMHEMGHALGVMHSDVAGDIMFPNLPAGATSIRASARDFATVAALYALPNGAIVRN